MPAGSIAFGTLADDDDNSLGYHTFAPTSPVALSRAGAGIPAVKVVYTVEGTSPDTGFHPYNGPFILNQSTRFPPRDATAHRESPRRNEFFCHTRRGIP